MYRKYYSLAQSLSTQYLEAQLRILKNGSLKRKAFRDSLETRQHATARLAQAMNGSAGNATGARRVVGIALLLCLTVFGAEAQSYEVKVDKNSRKEISTVFMINNFITPEFELAGAIMHMPNEGYRYIMAVNYFGPQRMNAYRLEFDIDGINYSYEDTHKREQSYRHEIVGFEVAPEIFKRIGTASSVRVRLLGDHTIERDLDKTVSNRFLQFYNLHIRR